MNTSLEGIYTNAVRYLKYVCACAGFPLHKVFFHWSEGDKVFDILTPH